MERSRAIAIGITLVSGAAFAATLKPMLDRIQDFNTHANFLHVHVEPIGSRTIGVQGFPEGRLTDDFMPDGQAAVKLEYVGQTLLIPVKTPPARDLPNLAAYEEWMKVLAMYEVGRDDQNRQVRLLNSERVMIVVRRTPAGFNPDTWGQVRRIDWVFDFYELKKDGAIAKSSYRWPRKARSEKRLQEEARGESDDKSPEVVASAKALVQYEPLKERTFEFSAAMHVIPKLSVPDHKFNDTAFSPRVLGWTLPVSMLSALAFAGGLVFAVAPRRRSQSPNPQR